MKRFFTYGRARIFFVVLLLIAGSVVANSPHLKWKLGIGEFVTQVAERTETWEHIKKLPLLERVTYPTPDLISLLQAEQQKNGYKVMARGDISDQELAYFKSNVTTLLKRLPESLLRQLDGLLYAIVPVKDLGHAGEALTLYSLTYPIAGIIVMDWHQSIEDVDIWATKKERLPFTTQPYLSVEVKMTYRTVDTSMSATEPILLHEIGHILTISSNIALPMWVTKPKAHEMNSLWYSRYSWTVDDDEIVTQPESLFSARKLIFFYDAKAGTFPMIFASQIYEQLRETGFPTLYGAQNPHEDFAEAFFLYVHTVLNHNPYEVRVLNYGQEELLFKPSWDHPKLKVKAEVIRRLINMGENGRLLSWNESKTTKQKGAR